MNLPTKLAKAHHQNAIRMTTGLQVLEEGIQCRGKDAQQVAVSVELIAMRIVPDCAA